MIRSVKYISDLTRAIHYIVLGKTILSIINKERIHSKVDHFNKELINNIKEIISSSFVCLVFDLDDQGIKKLQARKIGFIKLALYESYYLTEYNIKKILRKKTIQNINRSIRKLSESGELKFYISHGSEIKKETLDDIINLLKSTNKKRGINKKMYSPTFQKKIRNLFESDKSVIFYLYHDKKIISMAHCEVLGDNYLVYMTPAYNKEYQSYSPGFMLLLKIIDYCRENNLSLDLGKGLTQYKSRLTNKSYNLYLVIWYKNTIGYIVAYIIKIFASILIKIFRHGKKVVSRELYPKVRS